MHIAFYIFSIVLWVLLVEMFNSLLDNFMRGVFQEKQEVFLFNLSKFLIGRGSLPCFIYKFMNISARSCKKRLF